MDMRMVIVGRSTSDMVTLSLTGYYYPIINHVIVLPTCYYNSSRPPIPIQAL